MTAELLVLAISMLTTVTVCCKFSVIRFFTLKQIPVLTTYLFVCRLCCPCLSSLVLFLIARSMQMQGHMSASSVAKHSSNVRACAYISQCIQLSVDIDVTFAAKHLHSTVLSCAMNGHIHRHVRIPAACAQQHSTTIQYCGDICSAFTNCTTRRP